ncbi:GNAT family N-acetyltransferase [Aquincola sp. S2]|uniref:GNAT family N-acetyltransferase n=1 Tax=Pseudaquabacterium terrae TaxID=2732868 RepID=A0ABX2EMA0_9BURK|nr:GNAT family N-acetyltransferase [Aquabacterium terrae]NRF69719.1 GNAT family N-acetyltransferase [Aquabacterium terrae]
MSPSAPPITVRRATQADAAAYARIMGDPDVLPGLLQVPYTSEELWRTRLAEILAPGKPDLILVAERAGADGLPQVVGNAGLHPAGLQVRRRHVMGLGLAVASEAQGQGVGTALMQALCDWSDRWGQVLRMELNVFADNARAIALYTRFGFRQEGVHRAYALRDGQYVDTVSMARLHPAPPRIDAVAGGA